MATTTTASATRIEPTLRELAEEARMLKTLASDAVEDGLHAAHRSIRQARQTAMDARDELTYRVKREPLNALAIVFGLGAVIGLGMGFLCRRARRAS
jgi:ElaB/YqjD/DUF883 family membrane-anchored ribosome-binding protein